MKSLYLLLVCILLCLGIQLKAQEIIGRIDLQDSLQYHLIKFKGGPKFKAKVIDIRNNMLTYVARGDTIKSAIEEIKYIRVFQRRPSPKAAGQVDTSQLVLLRMKNGSELKGNLIKIGRKDISFRFQDQLLELPLRTIKNAYMLDDSTEQKIAVLKLENTYDSQYFDPKGPYFIEPILVVLRNGTQMVGKIEDMEKDFVRFRFQDQLLILRPEKVRKAFFLKGDTKQIDRKAYLFQSPFYGEGNSFVTPTGFLPGVNQIEYRTYYGMIHSVEGGITKNSSLTLGYSLPDILFGRVKLVTKMGDTDQYLSASATAVRSQFRDFFNVYTARASYTKGRPSQHFFVSAGYLVYDDEFESNRSFLISLGGSFKISPRWNFNYELFSFQDSFNSFIVLPTFTFGWMKRGNLFEVGLFGGFIDSILGGVPYLSYSKRIFR
ncbi:MAG: hypothetical protein AAF990_05435 [Bacteroidota bacterium]